VEIYPLDREIEVRCRDLMRQYRDLPMDLADATLVAVGEKIEASIVFTLDHKDFSIYRLKHKKRFKLLPIRIP
jgi:predicted nucleic acid-binding protein